MISIKNGPVVRAFARQARLAGILVTVALAGLYTAACDVHGPSDPGDLSAIVVTPNPQILAINGTQQFTAVGTDYDGAVVTFTPAWTVTAGGGTISATGLFTAGTTPGTFASTVKATSGSLSATATVLVTPGPLAHIIVTPTPVTLAIGATQQYIAVGTDAGGNVVQFTPTWSVVTGGGAVSSTGLFTAGTVPGTYTNTIQASAGSLTGTATVTVTPGPLATITVTPNPTTLNVGLSGQFSAVGKDANGNVVPISPVWSVANGGGTIGTEGLFRAGATPGTYTNTVKATSGSISGTATVTVTAGALATIEVTPDPATLAIGDTQQFTAVGKDVGGNVVPINPTWATVAGGGSVDLSTGLFTAGNSTGTYTNTVRASVGSVAGFATVLVTSGPLATIEVTPNPVSLRTNGTQRFVAVGKDGSGNVFVINPVWSVVNGGGSINSNTGVFTAGNTTGTFNNTVRATSGAISGAATVTVTAAPPPAPLVNLGLAAPNGIMAGTEVTCITGGLINADVSISPGNTLTGFGPCVITGVQHLADGVALQGQLDLTSAYNQLFGLPCAPANAIVADLGGTTKAAGVYCTASSIGVTGTLTLDGGGDPNATFVFQAGTSLITAGSIVLINGAQAKNVYWQVGTSATLGTASQWQGNILALTSITLVDNATLLGRALARNGAVSLGTNNVITLP
jgi:hypothetical protein